MITRYRCAMDGVQLDSISDNIIIHDIQEEMPNYDFLTAQKALHAGTHLIRSKRSMTSVSVSFEIHEYDIKQRKTICSDVAKWALGKFLSVNDREGQRLRVVCTEMPVIASSLRWTDTVVMRFTAYEWPYWEDESEESVTISGSGYITPNGNAEACLCSVTVSGVGSSVTLRAGDTQMTFTGLSSSTLQISYDDDKRMSARCGGVSVLANRTATSDDDLLVKCGERNAISVSSGSATFYTRGGYQ